MAVNQLHILKIALITPNNSKKENCISEANSCSATKEIMHLLWNLNFYYRVYKSPAKSR
jgi:hypothetical protein